MLFSTQQDTTRLKLHFENKKHQFSRYEKLITVIKGICPNEDKFLDLLMTPKKIKIDFDCFGQLAKLSHTELIIFVLTSPVKYLYSQSNSMK